MNATTVAAWLGAVTGCASFAWRIFEWSRQGARVHVDASPHMVLAGPPEIDCRARILITVTNLGTQATTLTHVYVFWFRYPLQKWQKRPAKRFFVPEPGLVEPLPHVLEPGRRWLGTLIQESVLQQAQSEGLTGSIYIAIYHSTAPSKPVICRLDLIP